MLLPPTTMLLLVLHVYLVRKHGVAPVPGDELQPGRKFYPEQAFRDTVAIFLAFAILFVMAAAVHVPLEELADPTDTTYVPRPEWYFLFLFQLLKFFKGAWEPVGSIGIPTVVIGLLFLVPFLDRSRAKAVRQRTVAVSVVMLALAGWTALTAAAVRSTPA